jgi:hypothetical protein
MEDPKKPEKTFEAMSPAERRHHNLRIFSTRLKWPKGVAEQLIAIAQRYPEWTAWWREGGKAGPSECVATLVDGGAFRRAEIIAHTPEELEELVRLADEQRQDERSRCPTCRQRWIVEA